VRAWGARRDASHGPREQQPGHPGPPPNPARNAPLSLLAPSHPTTRQLAAYLDSLIDQGYTIYVVRGSLPVPQQPSMDAGDAAPGAGSGERRWYTPDEVGGALGWGWDGSVWGAAAAGLRQGPAAGRASLWQPQSPTRFAPPSPTYPHLPSQARELNKEAAATRQVGGAARGVGARHHALPARGGACMVLGTAALDPHLHPTFAAPQRGKAQNAVETALARAAASGGALTLQPRKRAADAMDGAGGGGSGSGNEEDPELAAALAASLEQFHASQPGGIGGDGAGPSGSGAAVAAGGGAARDSAGAAGGGLAGGGSGGFEDDDPELAAALAASMEDYSRSQGQGSAQEGGAADEQQAAAAAAPAAPPVSIPNEPETGAPGALTVGLRLADGSVVTRRWRGTDTVGELRAFAAAQLGGGSSSVQLATQFPRRVLADDAAGLAAAGVEDRSVLTVTGGR
jgi:hypothetical protein